MNPADSKVRRRSRPNDNPRVLGWDAAGIVVERGPNASRFEVGAEVYFAGDVTRPGANSEFCLVDERIVGPKPKTLDFAEAAALPLTALTAHEALFARMRIGRGERGKCLLVVGAAGGVGSMAVQLAKQLTGLAVIGTASRDESAAWVRRLGADHVINHHQELAAQLDALSTPVDYVLCTADTDPYFDALAALVAPEGTLCFIVPPTRPFDMAPLHTKSVAVAWELMFTRPMLKTRDREEQHRVLVEVSELVDAGHIFTTLTERWRPIDAATLRRAHTHIESGQAIGKLVIEGWP